MILEVLSTFIYCTLTFTAITKAASHSGSSIWQVAKDPFKTVLEAIPWFMLGSNAMEQSTVDHLLRYTAVIKANDMACPVKPEMMNVRFDADCIGHFEDLGVCSVGVYKSIAGV